MLQPQSWTIQIESKSGFILLDYTIIEIIRPRQRERRQMDEQDIIRQICVGIPLACPACKTLFRYDRIDLKQISEKVWSVQALCSTCSQGYTLNVSAEHSDAKRAKEAVCGDRSIAEEALLRTSGQIPPDYESGLPFILARIWQADPKDDPHPPPTPV